ncbi:MAG: DUF1501 domain-containing protein [Verrucomicrobia bacterium]|nr:DUF1501 domain-containing protein [Verrucomicrobiota bacterium]
MNPLPEPIATSAHHVTRRHFLGRSATGIGTLALASLLNPQLFAAAQSGKARGGLPGLPHFKPRAKRVIYLFESGAPSQMDTLDYKPALEKLHGTELPDSIRQGQRLTGMTSGQKSFPVAKNFVPFKQYGRSGAWMSDLLPHIGGIADDICVVKTMHTEAINHDPAITFFQTGSEQPGRPSIGAWASYGLGTLSEDLPAFVVLISKNTYGSPQPLYARLWGSGFLPSNHQGVKLRSTGDPVLFLKDPAGAGDESRRQMLDGIAKLNTLRQAEVGDPEINTRIAAYEMAYRMQMSVPDLTDLSKEPESTFKLYGEEAKTPGTQAYNCLLARRLAERGARFIQLYHRDWDHHSRLPQEHPRQARETDQPSAALVTDLKQRGMLDDTLIVWGGEFGRTVYSQGNLAGGNYGRDHHPRCFSVWLAGGGIKPGISHGQTDDFCYNVAENPVHVHDLQATLLHCLGVNHERLTHRFQGRDYRLTDVHGNVVKGILA